MERNFNAEDFGMFKVASISPKVEIGNPFQNVENIQHELCKSSLADANIIVFPELCISGYTCADLFFQSSLLKASEESLLKLTEKLREDSRLIAVGVPLVFKGKLYNCAAVICSGEILGIVPKTNIPNYQEFYEKRWFTSGIDISIDKIRLGDKEVAFGTDLIFRHKNVLVGVEICEDLWVPSPPSSRLCSSGADVILNLSATDDNVGKYDYIRSLVTSQSGRCRCVYAYASAGYGESSTDLVFSGINLIASDGKLISESRRFSCSDTFTTAVVDVEKLKKDRIKYSTFFNKGNAGDFKIINSNTKSELPLLREEIRVDKHPFIPSGDDTRNQHCKEIIHIQSWGLARRLDAVGSWNLVVGISGGLDSTLALLIAHYTFVKFGRDIKNIIGVTMPSEATSDRTHSNANLLMDALGVRALEIPIGEAVNQHFNDIGHNPEHFNAVYENSQARERTQILMDIANKYSGIVLGTGDMSELALGWCTYNGDHMSMYNVNAGVPKTLVKYLVRWFADNTPNQTLSNVLADIINTPISPELIPSASKGEIGQFTENLVGPYELHDFFLFHVLRNNYSPRKIMFLALNAFAGEYEKNEIKKWLLNFYKRFFSQQFKRSCMPDGPKIGSVCLSPRGDWRMPSDATASLWIKETEEI